MATSQALRPERSAAQPTRDAEALAGLRLVPGLAVESAEPLLPPVGRRLRLTGTDEHLAATVAEQGQAPFAILYERHRTDLQRYCLSVVRDRDDAADAASEAWLRAFAALSSPHMRPISFRAWLYSIARNACTDRLRDRGRFAPHELSDDDLGGGRSSDEIQETRDIVRTLLGDLAVLSERQRSAISLREVAGLSLDEIAVTLETTSAKVISLIAEARRVLHERQAGRRLPCDSVRRRIDTLRVSSHRIRAHLDDCVLCSAHHARTRGRRLSSLALLPLALLRPALGRTLRLLRYHGAWGSAASKLAVAGSIVVVAGAGAAAVTLRPGSHRGAHGPRSPGRHAVALGTRHAGASPTARLRGIPVLGSGGLHVRSSFTKTVPAPSPPTQATASATGATHQSAGVTARAPASAAARPLSTLQPALGAVQKRTAALLDLGRKPAAAVQTTAKLLTTTVEQTSVLPRIKSASPSIP